jgi:preprotein translocase subunit Sss1
MSFPDPFYDPHRPAWKERAEAIEYWIVAILLVGAWGYGIYCGIRGLWR